MRRLTILTLFLLLISLNLIAAMQKHKDGGENWMNRNRSHKEKLLLKNKKEIKNKLDEKKWVIEFNTQIENKRRAYPIHGEANFILVNGDYAAIQFISRNNYTRNGRNNISISGNVISYKVFNYDEPKIPAKLEIELFSDFSGSSILEIYVDAKGGAIIELNLPTGERFTIKGKLQTKANKNG